jgi:hypothetical protein
MCNKENPKALWASSGVQGKHVPLWVFDLSRPIKYLERQLAQVRTGAGEIFEIDAGCRKPESQDAAQAKVWQEYMKSHSTDLNILQPHCPISSERQSSLGKGFLYFY